MKYDKDTILEVLAGLFFIIMTLVLMVAVWAIG